MDMDRKLVSKEPHEISYLAEKLGVSEETVRQAQKQVGRSRAKVEAFLTAQKAGAFNHQWVAALNYPVVST